MFNHKTGPQTHLFIQLIVSNHTDRNLPFLLFKWSSYCLPVYDHWRKPARGCANLKREIYEWTKMLWDPHLSWECVKCVKLVKKWIFTNWSFAPWTSLLSRSLLLLRLDKVGQHLIFVESWWLWLGNGAARLILVILRNPASWEVKGIVGSCTACEWWIQTQSFRSFQKPSPCASAAWMACPQHCAPFSWSDLFPMIWSNPASSPTRMIFFLTQFTAIETLHPVQQGAC